MLSDEVSVVRSKLHEVDFFLPMNFRVNLVEVNIQLDEIRIFHQRVNHLHTLFSSRINCKVGEIEVESGVKDVDA